jgi:hypothetical protein
MRILIFSFFILFYQITSAQIASSEKELFDIFTEEYQAVSTDFSNSMEQVPQAQKFYEDEFKTAFELGINPFLLLFDGFQITGEGVMHKNFGIEGNLIFGSDFGVFFVNGKYYLSPKYGGDNFYTGAFLGGGSDLGIGFGFLLGYKVVAASGFVFDTHFGLGRGTDDVTGTFKFTFGYRF